MLQNHAMHQCWCTLTWKRWDTAVDVRFTQCPIGVAPVCTEDLYGDGDVESKGVTRAGDTCGLAADSDPLCHISCGLLVIAGEAWVGDGHVCGVLIGVLSGVKVTWTFTGFSVWVLSVALVSSSPLDRYFWVSHIPLAQGTSALGITVATSLPLITCSEKPNGTPSELLLYSGANVLPFLVLWKMKIRKKIKEWFQLLMCQLMCIGSK